MADHLVVGGQLGNYLIDSVIGRGGMSVVYRAKHARLDMAVALKVLALELSSDDTFRERFLREAQIAAGIDHQNVIPIHDMGLHDDSLYIVMRYVAGGDLKALLTTAGPLDAEQALSILEPVALALDAAHAHGLVHRDVKPANILIQRSADGTLQHVYLTDFGIAKSASFSGGLTGAGASIGTVGYMAPEQLEGREVTAQTDVYALAVTFYECLTGRIPFQRELAEGIHPPRGEVEPLSHVRPDLPAALDAVIAKGLSRDLATRYGGCEQFLDACRNAVGSQPSQRLASAGGGVAATEISASEPTQTSVVRESAPAASGGMPQPSLAAAAAAAGQSTGDASGRDAGRDRGGAEPRSKRALIAGSLALLAVVAVVVAILLASGSSSVKGAPSQAALAEVPTNHVTGSGEATVHLDGNRAAITVTTNGLDNGAELVHLMHIHAGGKGECPPASAARLHNNHLAISTTDGINYYGPPVQALTTHGDTSVASILAFPRFLSGGNLHYTRTIVLPSSVAAAIRADDAVIVVHGTDYDGTGIYSGVLDASELSKSVPATATAPALCGRLVGVQNADSSATGSGRAAARYTASLIENATVDSLSGVFICHVGASTAAAQDSERRRTST
ncbi:MAG TPA: serine/threonine-protein kinase [Solirubrobacteraceae bacterium]|nr:serine/threonine-protein kinase [Solirubrobacteraceae bacterium]